MFSIPTLAVKPNIVTNLLSLLTLNQRSHRRGPEGLHHTDPGRHCDGPNHHFAWVGCRPGSLHILGRSLRRDEARHLRRRVSF
jgi:hypothetical protein